jgi:hypothetical protein
LRLFLAGNLRQLENAIEAAVALNGDRERLVESDFRLPAGEFPVFQPAGLASFSLPESGIDCQTTFARIERAILQRALQ